MNVTFTNLGTASVPVYSTQGKGFAYDLDPGEGYIIDSDTVTVASVGDNPTFREEVEDALETIVEAIAALVMFWKRKQPDADPAQVSVSIYNEGANALRVLLGSNVSEVQVNPGETYAANAPEYVEIRELGV